MRAGVSLLSLFCIFLCSFIGFTGSPAPVIRTSLTNIGAKQIDSCLLVYGINAATNSLVVEMYDPQLRLLHQCNEKIAGIVATIPALTYSSDLRLEFTVYDRNESQQRSVFLDKELKTYYKSQASTPPTLITAQTKVLDYYRIDDYAWEIRTEAEQIGWSGSATVTRLYQYGIKLNPSFPMKELNRAIVLDSFAVEYAKVFLVRDNKIYVYVNESTERGQQFIYCFNGLDGTLIYKTPLTVTYNAQGGYGSIRPVKAQACIFSKGYWNEKLNKLMIAGTWIISSEAQSGLFLVALNEDGTLNAGFADDPISLMTPVTYKASNGITACGVIANSYQCVRRMEYLQDGSFVVVSEVYGKKLRAKGNEADALSFVDDGHHYFCIVTQYYEIANGSIKLRNPKETGESFSWNGNHHLDSIQGFIPKQTKLSEKPYKDDINRICDGTIDRPYFESIFFVGKYLEMHLLSRNEVAVTASQNCMEYFACIASGANRKNCNALMSPYPVRGQNYSEQNDYFAIDATRLYRVAYPKDGYALSITNW